MSRRLKLAFAITAALRSFSQVTPMDQPSPAHATAMHPSHPGSRLGRLELRVTVLRKDIADLELAQLAGSAPVADPGLTSDLWATDQGRDREGSRKGSRSCCDISPDLTVGWQPSRWRCAPRSLTALRAARHPDDTSGTAGKFADCTRWRAGWSSSDVRGN